MGKDKGKNEQLESYEVLELNEALDNFAVYVIKIDYFAVRVSIHGSQNFRNSLVRYAHSFVSKVLQRVNKIRTKHFLWCNLFVIRIRPISCNKPFK